jgi:hypothetical protein
LMVFEKRFCSHTMVFIFLRAKNLHSLKFILEIKYFRFYSLELWSLQFVMTSEREFHFSRYSNI